jgi:hypothetical protein
MNLCKHTLETLYIRHKLPIRTVADRLKISHGTVHKALILHGIPRRPSTRMLSKADDITKPDLYYKYVVEGATIQELAKHYRAGIKTVSNKLREFEITKQTKLV